MLTEICRLGVLGSTPLPLCFGPILVSWSVMPLRFLFNDEFVCYSQAQRMDGKNSVMKQSKIRYLLSL